MGIRSMTPRVACPFCGCEDVYAGTILGDLVFLGTRVLGSVRCNGCGVEFNESWEENRGEEYDKERLEMMVAKWNRRAVTPGQNPDGENGGDK